jgi:hypothetical protein
MAKPKRPRDPNQLAKLIVDIATGAIPDDPLMEPTRGRPGNLRGGVIKAGPLTPVPRKKAAKK